MMKKGFTLLEVLVSISILVVAFLGPLAVATRSMQASSVSTNQVIAYNLAEEGMEAIINKRDSLIFANPSGGWNLFLSQINPCQASPIRCGIDITNSLYGGSGIFSCTNNNPSRCLLYRNNSTGLYSHNTSDQATIFTRTIYIPDSPSTPNERSVIVVISWQERFGGTRSFALERVIFNRR